MSTILDALRKLQRERAASNPSRDLRGSVTDEMPMPQPRRSPPRRGLAFGVLAVSLVILAGVGGTWLYKRGVFSRTPASPAQAAAQPPAAQPQVAEQDEPENDIPTDAELDQLERETKAREASDQAPPPVAASPTPPPAAPPATNADEAAAERARLEEVRRAAAAEEARRQAEAQAAADAEADAATAASPEPPPTAAMLAPAPPPALAPPPKPAPKPLAKPKPAPKAKPAPPPEPARREAPPDSSPDAAADGVLAPTAFPEVRVESIRWHPLAERRAASLRFAQQNVADAHEGDIIGGVLVFHIEPGAVELRVGSTSRVVRPGP